ncbi:MAG: thermonuclease family protein [Boseongicola sp.]
MRWRNVVSFDRTRRSRNWSLGDPRRGARRRRRRIRFFNPKFYLTAAIVIAGTVLVALPYGADAVNIGFGARSLDGCRVSRVVDGDTVTLWCPGAGLERTRLVGFDTPEKFDAGCASELALALRAEWHLRQLIATRSDLTVQRLGRDRYDRRLAVMVLDGDDVSKLMIDAGFARAYGGGRREGWCA